MAGHVLAMVELIGTYQKEDAPTRTGIFMIDASKGFI